MVKVSVFVWLVLGVGGWWGWTAGHQSVLVPLPVNLPNTHTGWRRGAGYVFVGWSRHGSVEEARRAFSLVDPYFLLPGWPGTIWGSDWLNKPPKFGCCLLPLRGPSLQWVVEPLLMIKPASSRTFSPWCFSDNTQHQGGSYIWEQIFQTFTHQNTKDGHGGKRLEKRVGQKIKRVNDRKEEIKRNKGRIWNEVTG